MLRHRLGGNRLLFSIECWPKRETLEILTRHAVSSMANSSRMVEIRPFGLEFGAIRFADASCRVESSETRPQRKEKKKREKDGGESI